MILCLYTLRPLCLCGRFILFNKIDKMIKHRGDIVGARAGFGMALEAEGRLVGAVNTLQRTGEHREL